MITAVLLVTLPFTFAGGDVFDLAESISNAKREPIVAIYYDRRKIQRFEIASDAFADKKDFKRLMKTKAGWAVDDGAEGMALYRESLPLYESDPNPESNSYSISLLGTAKHEPISEGAIKQGKLSIHLAKGQVFLASDLETLPFSKPVHIHWLYEGVPMIAQVKGVGESAFLSLTAKALGCSFRESDDGYDLGFNADEYRSRAIGAQICGDVDFAGKSSGATQMIPEYLAKANRRFSVAAYKVASDDLLNKVFEKPGKNIGFDLPNDPELGAALQEKIAAYQRCLDGETPAQGVLLQLFKMIDFSNPSIRGLIGYRCGIAVLFRTKSGGSTAS